MTLDHSVPQIGAPTAWAAGYTGKGVRVAVLDTGVDLTHPDLAGKVAESRNFTEEANPDDIVGHGTHVASTIAGSGAPPAGSTGAWRRTPRCCPGRSARSTAAPSRPFWPACSGPRPSSTPLWST
nr:S8 family serine peptidase [Micromonospora provocatoris]